MVAGGSGRIVTVFAAKGGCGKTAFAANLAMVLHRGGARRVCLIDLDLTFGDIASSLRLESSRSLASLLPESRALDFARIRSALTPFAPGLDCLLAPLGPGESEHLSTRLLEELLTELPRWYDHILIDTPAQLSPHVLVALDSADHRVLLTTPERPALRNLRLTLDMLDLLGYEPESRFVLLNRCASGVALSDTEVGSVLKVPIAGRIPASRDVPISINLGKPLVMSEPDHPVSRAVRDFARTHLISAKRQENPTQ